METKEQKAREYAKLRYGNNGEETSNEIAKVQACTVGYLEGWDEALKSQFRKCINNKPLKGEEPNEGENVILLCQLIGGINDGVIFPKANTFTNGDWACKMLMHYNIIAWMPIPSFDDIFNTNSHK